MYEILPITIRFHKHYCYEKMLKLGFVQGRAGNIPVTFYLWWWAQPSICPWYLSFLLKQKRAFFAMQSICWWMDLDKNMEKKSINHHMTYGVQLHIHHQKGRSHHSNASTALSHHHQRLSMCPLCTHSQTFSLFPLAHKHDIATSVS